ncbi:hypothetical protein WJX77_009941 [Trebouxia sp. C0004]
MQDGPLNMLAVPYGQSAPDSTLLAQSSATAAGELFSTVSSAECKQENDTIQSAIACADPVWKKVQQPAVPQSLHGLPASAFSASDQQSCISLQSTAAADFAHWQKSGVPESHSVSALSTHSQQCSQSLNTRQSPSSRTSAEDSCAFSLFDRNALLRQPQEQFIPDSAWHTDAASPTCQSSFSSGKISMALADTLLEDLFPQPRASLRTPDMQPALSHPGSLAYMTASTQQSISPTSTPLVQAAYDVGVASYQLQVWSGWERHAKDDDDKNSSDAVAPSAAESLRPEPEPPVQAQKCCLLGDSQNVQDLSSKDTLVKLKQQFHQLSSDEVLQYLDASAGNYHTAFALIQQCLGEDLDEQDSAKQALELTDLAVAQQLQKEEDSSPKSVLEQSASSSIHEMAPMQESDAKRPVTKDPIMQHKMEKLKGQFPHVSYGRLQNLLAAHEGCIFQTSPNCCRICNQDDGIDTEILAAITGALIGWTALTNLRLLAGPATRGCHISRNPNKKPGYRLRAQAPPVGSVLNPTTGLPLWLSPGSGNSAPGSGNSAPGSGNSAPGGASASKGLQKRPLKTERGGQSCGARGKVAEAKEQIAVCKREFQAAMRAGDVQKQRLYESWIDHWHQKLAEEKRAAQKKVQATKNAERSNTYKLDLHALHVDEALEEVANSIHDLSKMKCLHSVKQNPKLLPAVKQYLAARLIKFWDAPGMVLFMLRPFAD